MYLEINAGEGYYSLAQTMFIGEFEGYADRNQDVVDAFADIVRQTSSLPGGTGSLSDAVSEISARISYEEDKIVGAKSVIKATNDFVDLAMRIDSSVADLVMQNREEFYSLHPWLRPPKPEKEKNIFEKGFDLLCDAFEAVGDALEAAFEFIKDTAVKAWEGLKAFYNEYKEIINTVLIVVGAALAIVAVVATGGAALAPLLCALGCSSGVAAAISGAVGVVAVVSTLASSTLNIVDIWCEIDNPAFQKWKTGLNIVSSVSNITYSIGSIYNSIHHIDPVEFCASQKAPAKAPQVIKETYTDVSQLNSSQQNSIYRYSTNECYDNLNAYARGQASLDPKYSDTFNTLQSTLDNASLPDDMVLYRGTTTKALGNLKDLPTDQMIGQSFTDPAFMSTSKSSFEAMKFQKDMFMTIKASSGAHGMDIASISSYAHEAEVLFSTGQTLTIESAEWIDDILNLTVILK